MNNNFTKKLSEILRTPEGIGRFCQLLKRQSSYKGYDSWKYYQTHKKQIKEYQREYQREYYKKHRDKILNKQKAYRKATKERLSEALKTPEAVDKLCKLLKGDKRKERYTVKYIGLQKGKDRFDYYLQNKRIKEQCQYEV